MSQRLLLSQGMPQAFHRKAGHHKLGSQILIQCIMDDNVTCPDEADWPLTYFAWGLLLLHSIVLTVQRAFTQEMGDCRAADYALCLESSWDDAQDACD